MTWARFLQKAVEFFEYMIGILKAQQKEAEIEKTITNEEKEQIHNDPAASLISHFNNSGMRAQENKNSDSKTDAKM